MPLIASVLIVNQVWQYSFLVTACLGIIMAVIWCSISIAKEETEVAESLDAGIAPPPIFKTKQMKRYILFAFVFLIFMFALWRDALVAFILVIMMGLTMSGVYSITMVYANHKFPGMTRLVTSLVTAFAGFGAAVFPALIGYSMDHSGTVSALWYIASFAAIYLIILLLGIGRFYRIKRM